ncbi:hypothetical protein LTR85_007759 [Meristemomyces frigidus]|nr:hypothetical protein LTR85_007759 [Meristemomyces frigidus]
MASLESILESVARSGNQWNLQVNRECEQAFTAQHKAKLTAERTASATVTKNVKYGEHDRHRIDVYAPADATERTAVVVYFHGGGFTAGDNDISDHLHSNIGYYFASNHVTCVLATYRLLPEARFPDGADDVARCLSWVSKHIGTYGGSPDSISAIGQSAGGAHLAMALFGAHSDLDDLAGLQSVIFQSVPFTYNLKLERRRANMAAYHTTEHDREILSNSAVEIFARSKWFEIGLDRKPNFYIMVAQNDSDEIVDANLEFVQQYRKKAKHLPLLEVLEGHNHVSYALSIGLRGDKMGPRLLDIIQRST